MNDRYNLRGLGILVTRPKDQAGSLCRMIEELGGEPLKFPALEIAPPVDPGKVRGALNNVASYDILIFISVNAVTRGLGYLDNRLPGKAKIAAIGRATARALAEHGFPLTIVPEHHFDSEALLEARELQSVSGQRILIFRGEGGRAFLGDSLRARGASVEYAEVYRRVCPELAVKVEQLPWWSDLKLVTATSGEIIDNLLALFGSSGSERLLTLPLLVVSERMRDHARVLGFQQVILAEGPDDDSIMETLCRWMDSR